MTLMDIRNNIDHLDMQLVALLRQRMEYALQAGKRKDSVFDPTREEAILARVSSNESAVLEGGFIRELYGSIILQSKKLQAKKLRLAGFQGEHGAWSEIAVQRFGVDMVPIPCFEFEDVFSGVMRHEFDFGVVPVENSLEGSVNEVNDLLISANVHIIGEEIVPIHHNLLALPGSDHRDIRTVYSHPQALAQCRSFLLRNKLEARPFYDTAGAARWLRYEGPRTAGVIASSLAANIHGLEIVKERIEDHPDNVTRFVLLSTQPTDKEADKCTIAFSTTDRVGALLDVLTLFARSRINLTRIESRPDRAAPGAFGFLLDFQGRKDDPAVGATLEAVAGVTLKFKNLGFYPEAQR